MKRVSAAVLSAILVCGMASALQGCGSEESKPRRSVPVERAKSLEEMSPEERVQALAKQQETVRDLWMWPGGDAPRDPNTDAKACEKEMFSTPGLPDANGLVKLTWMASCMQQKGWELNPDSKLVQELQ